MPANRIVPDETRTDAIGIPRPRIHYRIDDYAKAGLALAMRRHEAIFAALQSTEVETLPMVTSSGTILGTTRMGNDPRQSVVDRDLRAHDHANSVHCRRDGVPDGGDAPSDADHRSPGLKGGARNPAGLCRLALSLSARSKLRGVLRGYH